MAPISGAKSYFVLPPFSLPGTSVPVLPSLGHWLTCLQPCGTSVTIPVTTWAEHEEERVVPSEWSRAHVAQRHVLWL